MESGGSSLRRCKNLLKRKRSRASFLTKLLLSHNLGAEVHPHTNFTKGAGTFRERDETDVCLASLTTIGIGEG